MKTNIAIIAIILLAAFEFGCSDNTHTGMNHNVNARTNSQNTNHGNMDHSSMKNSPNAATAPYDLQFLDTMAAHHQAAIDMARTAAAKHSTPRSKRLPQILLPASRKRSIK